MSQPRLSEQVPDPLHGAHKPAEPAVSVTKAGCHNKGFLDPAG